MAYHTGRRTQERTQQRQSQPQPNRDTSSAVASVVQNQAGRFVQQQPVVREEVEQDTQVQVQTDAEQMVQQMMTAGASAESMYQQTQAAQQETQEQSPPELSGTVFMPSPSSNTWVIQTINGDANLIEAGQNITLVQQGQSQSFVIQSMVGNTIILDESVPNQNIGSTLDFLKTIEPPQQTQDSGVEPMPTLPPAGVSAMNPMIGTLSPLGQWVWQGLSDGWVEYLSLIHI